MSLPAAMDIGDARHLSSLLDRLRALREAATAARQACLENWRPYIHRPEFLPSAANMGAYIGLRRQDLCDIQSLLAALGLSSLGRSEGHVLANLDAVIHALEALAGNPVDADAIVQTARAFTEAGAQLQEHTRQLLGSPPKRRTVCIMVTLPGEAASDYAFVRELVRRGMDCARINCAHDGPEAWGQMVAFVRQAAQEVGHPCQVMMDLAGPKLRTGPVVPDQAIVHLKVKRNSRGNIKEPAAVILDGSGMHGRNAGKDDKENRSGVSYVLPALTKHDGIVRIAAGRLADARTGALDAFRRAGGRSLCFTGEDTLPLYVLVLLRGSSAPSHRDLLERRHK